MPPLDTFPFGTSMPDKKDHALLPTEAKKIGIHAIDAGQLIVNMIGEYLTEKDLINLGKVSTSFYKIVKPIMDMKRYEGVVSVYPDLNVRGTFPQIFRKWRQESKNTNGGNHDIPFDYKIPIKSVTTHDISAVDLADVLVINQEDLLFGRISPKALRRLRKADLKKIVISGNIEREALLNLNDDFAHNYQEFFGTAGVKVKQITLNRALISENSWNLLNSFFYNANGLEKLVIQDLDVPQNTLLSGISKIKTLKSLSISSETLIACPDDLVSLLENNSLEELDLILRQAYLTDSRLEYALFDATKLKRLNLQLARFNVEVLGRALRRLDLEELELHGNFWDENVRISKLTEPISKMTNLKSLSVMMSVNGMRSQDISYLQGLKKLQKLEVYQVLDDQHLQDILSKTLTECPEITSLTLSSQIPGMVQNSMYISRKSIRLLDKLAPRLKELCLVSLAVPFSKAGDWALHLETMSLNGISFSFSGPNQQREYRNFISKINKSKTLKNLVFLELGAPLDMDPNQFRNSHLLSMSLQGHVYGRDDRQSDFILERDISASYRTVSDFVMGASNHRNFRFKSFFRHFIGMNVAMILIMFLQMREEGLLDEMLETI